MMMRKLVLLTSLITFVVLGSLPAFAQVEEDKLMQLLEVNLGPERTADIVYGEIIQSKHMVEQELISQVLEEKAKAKAEAEAKAKAEAEAKAEEERRSQASLRTGTPEANRKLARYLSGQLYGWSNDQFACLDSLVKSESRWKRTAQNPRSTAYGIFQFLNSTWGMTSYRKSSDAEIQIKAGFQYISKVYKTPCRAWNFKLATLKRNSSYAPSDLRGKARVWISKGYTGY